ncbi:HDOD domain-containing protein [Pelovirga terrestris]|uniref:HDOD domain-containing protein n=1 Tax=Pelovirga terrestris TaxID=2771352 RepID=A0A8J6UHC2_9BACT|nr:HDOD domain-containing protein [Pelovirga terrestris]MBD1401233.1 HDOD domain-containing protein [Pelovirga terrestris]
MVEKNSTPFDLDSIPPMPRVAAEIMTQLNSPQSSAERLADIIASDPAVAARVLRIANSSFYSMSRQVTNLSMAIVVLGERTLKNLVLAASLRGLNREFGPKEKMLWEDSMVCALAARYLAQALAVGNPEDVFVAGLFRHIGLIVMNNQPERNTDFIIQALRQGSDHSDYEQTEFGATHSDIGATVLEHWNLSEQLCYVARHHATPQPDRAVDATLISITAVVNIAGYLPGYFGLFGTPWQVDFSSLPGAELLQLDAEGLSPLIEEFRIIFQKNRHQFLA